MISRDTTITTFPTFSSETERDEWVREHIRYRLIAVDGLGWVCETFLSRDPRTKIAFTLNGFSTDYYLVTNALVDAGLALGRSLCELLGLRVRKGDSVVTPVRRVPESKGADVWPEDLGVRSIPFERACSLGPGSPEDLRDALTYFLIVANQGVAHLTFGSPATEVEKLRLATKAIRELCLTSFRESGVPMNGLIDAHHRFRCDAEFARMLVPSTDSSSAPSTD